MADRPAPMRSAHRRTNLFALLAIACVLPAWPVSGSELRVTPIVKAYQQVRPSVVNIRGEKTLTTPGPEVPAGEAGRRVNGMGTGVIIDPRGYIVTNFHVVDGVREIQVTLDDGQRYIARLLARDTETDLAVIKIEAPQSLPVVTLGTSSDLMPGETVIAVGNAFGYENTVTRGIVSALHRAVQVSDAQFYDDLIQTDAPINPGNSGGPLLNIDGQMIGINVAVRAGAQGIGFAIPVDKVLDVAAQLMAASRATALWHGVELPHGPAQAQGLRVQGVEPESPAAESGLQPGDLVESVEGEAIERSIDFERALMDHKPGDALNVEIVRDGEPLALTLVLAGRAAEVPPAADPIWDVFGLGLETIPAQTFRQQFKTRYRGGLLVEAVRADGPAAKQGIRKGDVLVGMHVWETISLDNVQYILDRPDFAAIAPVKFFIIRGSETLYGFMPVASVAGKATAVK